MQETQETRVRSLGWEDLPEKEMATPSSFLAWKIPWTEEPGRLQFMGLGTTERLSTHMRTTRFFSIRKVKVPVQVLHPLSEGTLWLAHGPRQSPVPLVHRQAQDSPQT